MTRKVIVLTTHDSLFEAMSYLNRFRISSAPVVNFDNQVVGYVSDEDCLSKLSNSFFFDEGWTVKVGQIMSKHVQTVPETLDVFELGSFFYKNHLHHAPVVDASDHLIGIVTRRDTLRALEKLIGTSENEREPRREMPREISLQDRIKMILHHT
jgi:CBS-domain-containing membrane protein